MAFGRLATQAVRVASRNASHAPKPYVRSYAAAVTGSSKPPVALYGLDGTYATALYTAAAKSSALDPTAKAMDALSQVFKKDPKLATILHAPTLSADDKNQIVAELQKHTANSGGDVIKNFLKTLAENNRLGVLESVCEKFGVLISAHKGEVELVVTSAAPLDNKVLKQLENAISKSQYVSSGQKLKVVSKVNPEIRGGLVVEIADRTIDLSVSSKIAKMNKLLTDTL